MQTIISLWIILVYLCNLKLCGTSLKGVDIGNSCQHDFECTLGNGGAYSKCNQDVNICICTINHLGEDMCRSDSDKYVGFCRPIKLYESPKTCTLECTSKGTKPWRVNEDWNGEITQPFCQTITDKKTSVCYDPIRALNTIPDGFEVKHSTIPNSGLGVFTNVYIEGNTLLGFYKGTFEPDDVAYMYSWEINPVDGPDYWTDGTDLALSNWLRYVNTPNTEDTENVFALQFKEKIYYMVFRPVHPGTELFIDYGDGYRKNLNLKPLIHNYYSREPGYVGGECTENGVECEHDKNTICADTYCVCRYGTRERSGICLPDERLGGHCVGSNGETCKHDKHAECQRGVCVCKNYSIPTNDRCIPDERLGGHCVGSNGDTCKHDKHAECQRGVCVCKNYSIPTNDRCIPDETFGGRCASDNGQKCLLDNKTVCSNGVCRCIYGTSPINGKCVTDESYGGRCNGDDGDDCELDENAECSNNICVCKKDGIDID